MAQMQVQKVMSVEAHEFVRLIKLCELQLAEVIRLEHDYKESQGEKQTRNRFIAQKDEIARLEAVLASKKAQLSKMRRDCRNAVEKKAQIKAQLEQHKVNLAGRINLEKMQEMQSLFKQMRKAGIAPPEFGQTVKVEDIVS